MAPVPTARPLVGTRIAAEILDDCAARSSTVTTRLGRPPSLAAVLVGDDEASATYVRMKRNRCSSAGIDSRVITLPTEATTAELIAVLNQLSEDDSVDGILLQHPVPSHVDERAAFEAIHPDKDVDGVTLHSFASMALGVAGFESCTPAGIIRLLDASGVSIAGKHAVVVGRSPILGKPVAMLLLARNRTVTICHSHTADLAAIVATGDIVVAAVGVPELIRGDWIKPGATVIDAGYNPGNLGDVDAIGAFKRAANLTPVPGGVGPMTIAVLLDQTVRAAEHRATGGVGPARGVRVQGLPTDRGAAGSPVAGPAT